MTANDYSIEKYVSEYLKPLEEIGLIQNIRIENNGEVWFYMKAKIKDMTISGRIIPGTEFDIVTLQTYSYKIGSKILPCGETKSYTDDLKVCLTSLLINLMDDFDELL
jgi:hypothetical protein